MTVSGTPTTAPALPPPLRLADIAAAEFLLSNRSRVHGAGLDLFEYEAVTADISTLADWTPRLLAAHAQWAARAEGYEEAGRTGAAIESWLTASRWAHFAGCLPPETDRSVLAPAVGAAAHAHRRAVGLRDPAALWLESTDARHPFVGVLRLPGGGRRSPVVLIVPGLDSAKEEFDTLATVLLSRGAAVLSIDGPGQGELAARTAPTEQYEQVVGAALDSLAATPGDHHERIDLDRVGLIGLSLGGFYVLRAATDPRIRATVDVSGVAQIDLTTCLSLIRDTLVARCGSEHAAVRFAATVDGPGAAATVSTPLLVVAGGQDVIPLPSEARQIAEAAPRGELLWSERGDHLLGNRLLEWRSDAVDWLLAQLDSPNVDRAAGI